MWGFTSEPDVVLAFADDLEARGDAGTARRVRTFVRSLSTSRVNLDPPGFAIKAWMEKTAAADGFALLVHWRRYLSRRRQAAYRNQGGRPVPVSLDRRLKARLEKHRRRGESLSDVIERLTADAPPPKR